MNSRIHLVAILAFVLFAGLAGIEPALAQEGEPIAAALAGNALSFPREISEEGGTVVVHTPQIDSWKDFSTVQARAVIEVTPAAEDEAIFGVVEFAADTDPNLELRVVAVENIKILATSFPVEDDKRRDVLDEVLRNTLQPKTQYVPLDVILSYIAPDAAVPEEKGLSFEPPPIFYSNTPALLLITDGEPLLAPIEDTKLQYVVNTNWDLFRYREKEWYLRYDSRWFKNKSLEGNWKIDSSLPSDFKKLPDDGNWTDVKSAIPPTKGDKSVPTVLVSNRPAELILVDGTPHYRVIGVDGLQYVADTESDLFRLGKKFYYLVSGRWFSADQLRGPWVHVAELPGVFATIPPEHEKGHVLAAVPNTDEARLAALEATLPRKATINRNVGESVLVSYQGEPTFELIPGTDIERAANSANDILKVGDLYYLCDNAVWYVSTKAEGPWVVADTIPAAIYTIPASSPSYHVTHVHVYESDTDTVSTGYTSGYFGVYVGFGIAMYGSGWYYPPYYGHYSYYGYPYYPYYYPYPYSYGSSAWYNPKTGAYGRSGSVYGPYGGYGRASAYNPQTGAYARGAAVWDNNEIAGSAAAYNPRTGTGVATNRYANEHGGWGESLVTHNDKWLQTQSEWDNNSRTTDFRTSEGGSGTIDRERSGDTVTGSGEFQRGDQSLNTRSVRNEQGTAVGLQTGDGQQAGLVRTADGDLYAGKDGQVYKRGDDGWYQQRDGAWNKVEVPDERATQIDQSRNALNERTETAGQNRATSERASNRTGAGENRSTLSSGGFAESYGNRSTTTDRGRRSYDSTRNRDSFDTSRRNELDRSQRARSSGYDRYNSRSAGNISRQTASGRQIQRRRR